MQSAKYWKKRSIQRTVRSEKASEKYAKQIDRVYQNASKRIQDDINQIYRTYGKQQGIDVDKLLEKLSTKETANFWKKMTKTGDLDYIKSNYKSRISRLEQLQGELYSRVHEMRTQENDLHTKAHTNTIDEAYHRTVFDTSKGVGANISFGGLNKNTLDTLMNDNWQGSTFSKRIWGNTDSLGVKGKDILGSALLTGKSRARVATEFTELFGVARNSAERLIRTETNYYQNEAEAIASIDMGLEEYIYVAVLDKRTSSICASTDTLKFKYKDREQGRNYPPLHPNCRSTTRPFVGDEYEPKTRKARDVNGDPITIKSVSYKEWREKYGIDKVQQPTKVPTPKPTTTKIKIKEDGSTPIKIKTQKAFSLPVETRTIGAIDPALKATMRSGMNEVYKQYPQAFDRLDKVLISKTRGSASNLNGVHKIGVDTKSRRTQRGVDGKLIVHSDGKLKSVGEIKTEKSISIRIPQDSNTLEKYSKQVNGANERGWWATNNPKAVMYHELGHGLESTMNMKQGGTLGSWDKFKSMAGKKVIMNDEIGELRNMMNNMKQHNIANELVKKSVEDINVKTSRYSAIKSQVSEYGAKKDSEAFAELFSKVMNGDKDPLTVAFKLNLDNKLKELDL